MKILITGYPGFLSNYLVRFFDAECNVYRLGLSDASKSNHIVVDLSNTVPLLPNIEFDIVVHAAGKAHIVPKNKDEEDLFYKVNFDGTVNLIRALNNLSVSPKSFIFISTVAVYGRETGESICETAEPCPNSAYAKSKKLAEEYTLNWKTTARKMIVSLPLIVGKNPPGNLGKMIDSIKKGVYFNIGDGKAKRSMVLAEDIARFIPTLAQHEGIYNLTDGYHPSFAELQSIICEVLKKRKKPNIPYPIAKLFAKLGDKWNKIPFNSNMLDKMTNNLTFSDEKARRELGWNPRKVLNEIPNIFKF